MKKVFLLFTCLFLFQACGGMRNIYEIEPEAALKDNEQILNSDDFLFLEELTKNVLEKSRIYPEQVISSNFGPNNTGGILIRPGGRDTYPSFWIRDYAMSLDSGLISLEEQKHMLQLTALKQCDQSWITDGGSMVPLGAIADHIRIDDSLPIYFPGTYSYKNQGISQWGIFPPYCDQFYFIHMAYYYAKQSSDYKYLLTKINGFSLIDRLEMAYKVPPTRPDNPIVYTTKNLRGVDYGFRDAIIITGDLCFSSILKYQASVELAYLFKQLNDLSKSEQYKNISESLKKNIIDLFYDQRGMLKASTGIGQQPDVWSSAFAVYLGIIEGENLEKTCQLLADSYANETLAYKGNIRHILTTDDFSSTTAWEIARNAKNIYQNGAYWGTPTGWVCYAIAKANPGLARKLAKEFIEDLRMNDFRKGENYGAPYECFHPSGHRQNPVYLTSVACPYAVFRLIRK